MNNIAYEKTSPMGRERLFNFSYIVIYKLDNVGLLRSSSVLKSFLRRVDRITQENISGYIQAFLPVYK